MASPNIDRRAFLRNLGGLSASVLLASGELRADPPSTGLRRPNFLVLVADDQCYRTINALNNSEVHTPNFDRMVKRGTTFTHCFHQGSWTGAICVASRAMLHTGRYVWKCGGDTCGDFPLLGETLQRAGYATHLVGKWHNGDQTALRSFQTGNAIGPAMYESGPLAYDRPRPDDPWTPWDPKYRGQWTPHVWDIVGAQAGPRHEVQQHSCELYADTAARWLGNRPPHGDQPFFLYVAWNAPHDPRQAPKEFLDRYPTENVEVPPNFLAEHPFDQGDNRVRDEKLAPFPRTPEAVRLHRREYYALITYLDAQLGRILDALDQSGQAESTYVIITGDHGLAVGEHGLLGKQNLYDCSTRMPFIIAGPGIQPGRKIDALMYQHSLFPTICELANVPIPATVEFPSLVPLLREKRGPLFDSVYCGYRRLQRMVRTETHKLILYPQVKQVQLFDLTKDPWEMNNLAADPSQAGTLAGLFRELKKWQGTVGDPLVLDPAAFGIKA